MCTRSACPRAGPPPCTHHVTTKRQSVKREMDQSGLFVKQIQKKKKNPIIILELKKKSLLYKMAKHFMYSVFLDKSQGLHSPIHSEPERPVTKVTLITT